MSRNNCAIGKDYVGTKVFGSAPSGSGFQFSLFGLLGLTASAVEGLSLPMRDDVVTAGNDPEKVLKNAPKSEDGFFVVPKVVE